MTRSREPGRINLRTRLGNNSRNYAAGRDLVNETHIYNAPGSGPGRKITLRWVALLTGLAVTALALLAVLVLRPQSPAASVQSRSTPPSAFTAPASAAASAPAGGGATTAQPPASTSGGWAVRYHDTSITLPPVEGPACQLASMDFDPPRGYEGSADAFSGSFDDLTVQTACIGNPANITSHAKAWGTSSPQEPGPDQCLNDANQNGLPNNLPLSKITIGSAYCLITTKGSLAWFKATAKPGSEQQGLTVVATGWSQPNGN